MSLDEVRKQKVTEIHEYWQVMNSKILERKTEKHEIQMLKGTLTLKNIPFKMNIYVK